MEIVHVSLLLLALPSAALAGNGLADNALFQKFLDKTYEKKESPEKVFMNLIWPSVMSNLLPASAILPAMEDHTVQGRYRCATEANIFPKLKSVARSWYARATFGKFGQGWTSKTEENQFRIEVDVEFELAEPVKMDFAEEKGGVVIQPIPISYLYKGKNIVRVVVTVPRFLQIQRSAASSRCLVNVVNLYVKKLSGPSLGSESLRSKEVKKLASEYKKIVSKYYYKLFDYAFVKAANKNLEGNSWLCADRHLKETDTRNAREEYAYSPEYTLYCKGKKVE